MKRSVFTLFLVLSACGGEFDEESNLEFEQQTQAACTSKCTSNDMIIGCDNRLLGATTKTAALKAPYRSVGDFTTGCTGTLIGDRYVLTAAHCFKDLTRPSQFILARHANANGSSECRPFGKVAVKRVYIPGQYSHSSNSVYNKALDIAIAELDTPIVGAQTLPYGPLSISRLLNKKARTIGYPYDKPDGTVWKHTNGSFIYDSDQWINGGERGVLHSNIDGVGGQSGSPTYVFHNGKRRVVGVLIGSPESECLAGRIWSSRITPSIRDHIDNVVNPGWDFWWTWTSLPNSPTEAPNC